MKSLNFNIDILEKNKTSPYLPQWDNAETKKPVYNNQKPESFCFKNKLTYIQEVPNYLKTTLGAKSKDIRLKAVNTYSGSLINLTRFKTIEEYLKIEVSTKERSEIRRRQKRLDNCIRPVYKVYYGTISKAEYTIIFNDYKKMLVRRLEQKQSYWEELDYWEQRYESTYKLIKEKKACIYVIYHHKKPIAIYINSIFDKIIFNEVVAYDIDYSRFNIGILIFIKVIAWSITNDFEIMDMSKGDFSYKERFRNGSYTFQNHIIYDAKNIPVLFRAKLLILKLNLVYKILPWLKKIKINKLYTHYKRLKNRHWFKEHHTVPNIKIKTEKLEAIPPINTLKLIDVENENYTFLKKPLIDFAFLNVEYIDTVQVFEEPSNVGAYILKGEKAIQKTVIIH